jgi:DNA-binding NtrC family response regulator
MKRVLVIDSEPTGSSSQIRQRLQSDGYLPSLCRAPGDALQCFRDGAEAVILVRAPADLGLDFWQELRALVPVPSVLIVPHSISSSLDTVTFQSLREGSVYLSIHRVPGSDLEYELPQQGINFYDLERSVLSQALEIASGNQTRAANLLGLSRDQVRYRMSKFGLNSSRGRLQTRSSQSAG